MDLCALCDFRKDRKNDPFVHVTLGDSRFKNVVMMVWCCLRPVRVCSTYKRKNVREVFQVGTMFSNGSECRIRKVPSIVFDTQIEEL